jgi:hypothetical protein
VVLDQGALEVHQTHSVQVALLAPTAEEVDQKGARLSWRVANRGSVNVMVMVMVMLHPQKCLFLEAQEVDLV